MNPAHPTTKRSHTNVNAYLILKQKDKFLLSLRKNTGYCDGFFGLVSGHVEDGESATSAIIREAYEEAGIILEPDNLKCVHTIHRKTDRLNVDLFFECSSYSGNVINRELQKCEALEFHSLSAPPTNTIDYIASALHSISQNKIYSEQGWI